MVITDTFSIELRANLNGREISLILEMRLGHNLLRLPSFHPLRFA